MGEKKIKKISNTSLVIFLIILSVAALCLVVGIVLEVVNSKDNGTTPSNPDGQVEVYKPDINEKLDYIISDSTYYKPGYESGGNTYFADKKTTKAELNRSYMLKQKIKKAFADLDLKNATEKELKDVLPSYDANKSYKAYRLDESVVKERYKAIWNEDISTKPLEGFNYYYSENNHSYIYVQEAVIYSSRSFFEYLYNSEETADNYIFYMAVAIGERVSDEKINIYKDIDLKEVLGSYDYSSFNLDDKNYQGFTKYKVVFTKDGEDFYFESVERI